MFKGKKFIPLEKRKTRDNGISTLLDCLLVERILTKKYNQLVLIRFGNSQHIDCKIMDKMLIKLYPEIYHLIKIYFVDTNIVTEYNELYELNTPFSIMFFYEGRHVMLDLGTGDNNKINWVLNDPDDLKKIIEVVYNCVIKEIFYIRSPIDFSIPIEY